MTAADVGIQDTWLDAVIYPKGTDSLVRRSMGPILQTTVNSSNVMFLNLVSMRQFVPRISP